MATILVVDDDPQYGNALDRMLQGCGFTVFVASSGEEALDFVKWSRPDLILLDWFLGKGIPGPTLLRAVKSHPTTKTIPVVMISGEKKTAEDELKARQTGAAMFLVKTEISLPALRAGPLRRHLDSLIQEGSFEETQQRLGVARRHGGETSFRVLAVDDDPEVLRLLALVLETSGHKVLTAETGAAALDLARREFPDVILLDLSLPDIDGYGVCSRLKSIPELRAIPVIMLTADSSDQARLRAARHGADHFLAKPISGIQNLHDWIQTYIDRGFERADQLGLLRVRHITVNLDSKTVMVGGNLAGDVTGKLFQLLCEFARRPEEVLAREHLLQTVWRGGADIRNVDTAVGRLRRCLGLSDDWFMCIRRVGYRMLPLLDTDARNSSPEK